MEQEIAGNDHLKEVTVGIEVFERPASFDPRIDPVVRVQARRLRKKLHEYYSTAGTNDAIRIEMPVGGYSPVISNRRPCERSRAAAKTSLAVLPFRCVGTEGGELCDDITEELIVLAARLAHVRVVSRTSVFQFREGGDVRVIGEMLRVEKVLEGTLRALDKSIRVRVQLVATADGLHLWCDALNFESAESSRQQLAREIAEAVFARVESIL